MTSCHQTRQSSDSIKLLANMPCRLAPIESRRAGLRGGKPLDAPQASPDENRPSNDQSGAEEFNDRADSEDGEASEYQAATSSAADGDVDVQLGYVHMNGTGQAGQEFAGQQTTHFSHLYQRNMPANGVQPYVQPVFGSSLPYPLHT